MPRQVIHRQIFDKGSLTSNLVSITLEIKEYTDNLCGLKELTQALVYRDCNYYMESVHHDMLCQSGEINGKPFAGAACNRCVLGQYSPNGKFVGELADNIADLSDGILRMPSSKE